MKRQGFSCVVIGDFNCNLSKISSLQSSRTSLIKNLFGDYLAEVGKDRDFTYIHSSSSVSNLDHIAISQNLTVQNFRVVTDYQISDDLPVSSSVHIVSSNCHQTRQETQQPKFRLHWLKADKQVFSLATEEILNKIRIPFNLQKPKDLSKEEVRICLNIYCTEIYHALLHAERLVVPKVQVRKGMVQKWPENHSLVAAHHRAKFWFSLWIDCGCPRSGIINSIRLTTKRRFSKELSLHRKSLVDSYSARGKHDRNFLFKSVSLAKPTPLLSPSEIPVEDWYSYYTSEFAAPKPQLEDMYERELDEFLDKLPHGDFVVSLDSVIQAVCRLKNKSSYGIDRVSAIHIKHGGSVLARHLSLLMQMIFTQDVVPLSFCVGDLTPIPKKGKNDIKCSFHPITVVTSLCKLFELLFINELETKCYTPPRQFEFKRPTGCADALMAVVVSVLLDADFSGESIVLASHDISRSFDSLIHAAMLLKASQRGLNPCIVRSLRDMYSRLSIRLKLPPDKNLPPRPHEKLIPVLKDARQGAVSSPHLFNNYVLQSQDKGPTSCILSSIDASLVCYADDVLNLIRTLQKASDNFETLKTEYLKLGLSFNTEKTEIVLFNWQKTPHMPSLLFGENLVNTADHINYLGVLIGSFLGHTRLLLIKHLNRRISGSYASIVSAKFRFSRLLLARLYNYCFTSYYLPGTVLETILEG